MNRWRVRYRPVARPARTAGGSGGKRSRGTLEGLPRQRPWLSRLLLALDSRWRELRRLSPSGASAAAVSVGHEPRQARAGMVARFGLDRRDSGGSQPVGAEAGWQVTGTGVRALRCVRSILLSCVGWVADPVPRGGRTRAPSKRSHGCLHGGVEHAGQGVGKRDLRRGMPADDGVRPEQQRAVGRQFCLGQPCLVRDGNETEA